MMQATTDITVLIALIMAGAGFAAIGLFLQSKTISLNDRLHVKPEKNVVSESQQSILLDKKLKLPLLFTPMVNKLAQLGHILAGSDRDRYKLQKLLLSAGFRSQESVGLLMIIKLVLGICLVIVVLFVLLDAKSRWGMEGLAGGLLGLFAGSTLPELWLRHMSAKRGGALTKSLPDALDLMVICAEAGLPLSRVLQVVSKELVLSAPEMADELRFTFAELQILNNRSKALAHLSQRTGVSGIESMVATLIQAERYGTPLSKALRTISDESRKTLILELEERAGKLPAQLSVPLMVFILPPIVAMMGAPALVRIVRILGN